MPRIWGLRRWLVPPALRWILAEAKPTSGLLSCPLCSAALTVPGFQLESREAGPGHFWEEAMEAGNVQELDHRVDAEPSSLLPAGLGHRGHNSDSSPSISAALSDPWEEAKAGPGSGAHRLHIRRQPGAAGRRRGCVRSERLAGQGEAAGHPAPVPQLPWPPHTGLVGR